MELDYYMGRKKNTEGRERAFELYCKLNRNKSAVSRELGVPVQTVGNWCKEEEWDIKLDKIQSRLREEYNGTTGLPDRVSGGVLQEKIDDLDVLGFLYKALKAIAENGDEGAKVEIKSWSDVIKTIELIQKEKRTILGIESVNQRDAIDAESMNEEQLDEHIKDLQRFLGGRESDSSSE